MSYNSQAIFCLLAEQAHDDVIVNQGFDATVGPGLKVADLDWRSVQADLFIHHSCQLRMTASRSVTEKD